jgi:hypothetical protein
MDKMRAKEEEMERAKKEAAAKAAADKKSEIENSNRSGHLIASQGIIQSFDKWVLGKMERQKSLQV